MQCIGPIKNCNVCLKIDTCYNLNGSSVNGYWNHTSPYILFYLPLKLFIYIYIYIFFFTFFFPSVPLTLFTISPKALSFSTLTDLSPASIHPSSLPKLSLRSAIFVPSCQPKPHRRPMSLLITLSPSHLAHIAIPHHA